ncbi:MAG TPA: alanine--tRNA ligase [Acidimicrobiales bacterium]|nr:alanine--tRNA ligase [Acidimicrobiales bacterium]
MDANQLRSSFLGFFAERAHQLVPSASLVPRDPSVLFTIAGMVPFKPYFTGENQAPWPRAAAVQKCFRTVDIDNVGASASHDTFFEMLGNFSFGDYFKERAIPLAWELVTEVLGIDAERLWVTVHESDDEAEEIWVDATGVHAERIQRLGDEGNFWKMGETGPSGPCSELFFDKGERFGAGGGPRDGAEERYVELWNLVFMQYNRMPDGSLVDLPKKNIDTGMGLERMLAALQGVDTIFDTDAFTPLIETAERILGARYGTERATDIAIRRLADHGRAMTMLISDGVLPSNDGRGYVLRRLIRRAILAARRLGVEAQVTGPLAETTVELMKEPYPNLPGRLDLARSVLEREEAAFDRTLKAGLGLLEEALDRARAAKRDVLDGEAAFRLHDTHGFPIELTEELAGEAGFGVERAAFDSAMQAQRDRARAAARTPAAADEPAYRALLESEGETAFVGRSPEVYTAPSRIIGVLAGEKGTAEIFLDRTPFYAEGGGQVGDKGTIVTETGRAEVFDTVSALPGLTAHRAKVTGEIYVNQDALSTIDAPRREATRRNHTGTHLLHAALREVLGDHVHQQGSYVAPDRLRFDFSHHQAPAPEELAAVSQMANRDVLGDDEVQTTETTLAVAEAEGAMAFFGDKYGDVVRMVRAGPHSLELCGGTHVHALGQIGPISIVSEGSIGANTRRIFAVTGEAALSRTVARERQFEEAARLLKTEPDGVVEALERLLERQREAEKSLLGLRRAALSQEAVELAASAEGGVVVARRDGRPSDELRALAQGVLKEDGVRAAVIGGALEDKVNLVIATGGSPDAGALVKELAGLFAGSGGGTPELGVAGGRDPLGLEKAMATAGVELRAR